MKVLSAAQTAEADAYTIANAPISSLALMERAGGSATDALLDTYSEGPFYLFCGPGNNGGDGLVMARLLASRGRNVEIWLWRKKGSADFNAQLYRLAETALQPREMGDDPQVFPLDRQGIVIDALFGSGLNRPLAGALAPWIAHLNAFQGPKVAVDLPSGLFADGLSSPLEAPALQADLTLTFQHPKRALLRAHSAAFAGKLVVLDIGLLPAYYDKAECAWHWLEASEMPQMYRPRKRFTHKGQQGHAYLWAGQLDKAGAALICAEATLRAGCGLLTVSVPKELASPFNARLPEAMLEFTDLPASDSNAKYNALGLGPGLGTAAVTAKRMQEILGRAKGPLVIDADGLNLLAQKPDFWNLLPPEALLTPHPGEAARLLGQKSLPYDYVEQFVTLARKYRCGFLLKNTISKLITPQGEIYAADFGHPGLAKGGSGDLLTGLCLGLRAQAYPLKEAALLAIYLQGQAAKMAAQSRGGEGLLSSEVLTKIGEAWQSLET